MPAIVKVTQKGDFSKTKTFLKKLKERRFYDALEQYGNKGVELLSANTPMRTGKTASSWSFVLVKESDSVVLEWHNNSMGNDGKTPIALLIQLGHGTRTGGYVPPNDYINPVMKPLFDEIADYVGRAVKSL